MKLPKIKINTKKLEKTFYLLIVNLVSWYLFFTIIPPIVAADIGLKAPQKPLEARSEVLVQNQDNYAIEAEIGSKAWAIQKWSKRFGNKVAWQLEVIMDTGESGWDADAFHCNTNGSVDLSWYQLNTVHLNKVSLACLADPICGTEVAMDLYEEQGWCAWYGSDKLGFCDR